MLGGIGGRRKRGRQRMRWLDGITGSMDMSLGEPREGVGVRPGAVAQSPGREAALAWASLAQRFPASSVLAREGAGCGSVGDLTGAWLASAPLSPSLCGVRNGEEACAPVSPRDEALFDCAKPRGVPRSDFQLGLWKGPCDSGNAPGDARRGVGLS